MRIQRYPINTQGRTFVMGDIHGCLRQFNALLDAVGFDFANDVLYQNGDFINRGPNSYECYQLIFKPWFRATLGNHEWELIQAMKDPGYDWLTFVRRGAGWAYNTPRRELEEIVANLAQLPTVIVVGEGPQRFNVFHGEFHGDDEALDRTHRFTLPPVHLIHGRELAYGRVDKSHHNGLSPSFVGHTVVNEVLMIGSHIYLDTGSYQGENNPLSDRGISIIEPATGEVWKYSRGQVKQTVK